MNPAIEEQLKQAGLKITRQRTAILSLLIEGDVHLSAEQIYFALKTKGEAFGLATVYRTLALLEQAGILAKTEIPGSGRQSYFYTAGGHRHQLLCTGCGRIILLKSCPAEAFLKAVEEEYDFAVTGHSFEIFGLCPDCRKKAGQEERHVH